MVQHDFPIDHDVERTWEIVLNPWFPALFHGQTVTEFHPRTRWVCSKPRQDVSLALTPRETLQKTLFLAYARIVFCTSTAPYPEPEDPSLCFDKGIENFLVHDEIFHYRPEVDMPSSLKRLVLCWMWNRLISLPVSMVRYKSRDLVMTTRSPHSNGHIRSIRVLLVLWDLTAWGSPVRSFQADSDSVRKARFSL